MNFLDETLEILKENNKTPEDVRWCGSKEWGYFSFNDFHKIANFQYSNGFGGQEIAKDLMIVGEDWYLERGEYDGSEWWEFKQGLSIPKKENIPTTLCNGDSWATLVEMNRDGGKYI